MGFIDSTGTPDTGYGAYTGSFFPKTRHSELNVPADEGLQDYEFNMVVSSSTDIRDWLQGNTGSSVYYFATHSAAPNPTAFGGVGQKPFAWFSSSLVPYMKIAGTNSIIVLGSRNLSAGNGINTLGDLSADRTVGLTASGTAGTYDNVVADAFGRIKSGTLFTAGNGLTKGTSTWALTSSGTAGLYNLITLDAFGRATTASFVNYLAGSGSIAETQLLYGFGTAQATSSFRLAWQSGSNKLSLYESTLSILAPTGTVGALAITGSTSFTPVTIKVDNAGTTSTNLALDSVSTAGNYVGFSMAATGTYGGGFVLWNIGAFAGYVPGINIDSPDSRPISFRQAGFNVGYMASGSLSLVATPSSQSFLQLDIGDSSPVSFGNTLRFRYNKSTNKAQVSLSGAAYTNLMTTAGTLSGSYAVGSTSADNVIQLTTALSGVIIQDTGPAGLSESLLRVQNVSGTQRWMDIRNTSSSFLSGLTQAAGSTNKTNFLFDTINTVDSRNASTRQIEVRSSGNLAGGISGDRDLDGYFRFIAGASVNAYISARGDTGALMYLTNNTIQLSAGNGARVQVSDWGQATGSFTPTVDGKVALGAQVTRWAGVHNSGSVSAGVNIITGSTYNVGFDDYSMLCTFTGSRIFKLPSASFVEKGFTLLFKDSAYTAHLSGGTMFLTSSGLDTIDVFGSQLTLNTQGIQASVVSDGTSKWYTYGYDNTSTVAAVGPQTLLFNTGSGTTTSVSSSFANINPQISATFSASLTKKYLIETDISCFVTNALGTGPFVYFQTLVDGVVVGDSVHHLHFLTNSLRQNLHMAATASLVAGTHTLNVQWKTTLNATMSFSTDDWREFTVIG